MKGDVKNMPQPRPWPASLLQCLSCEVEKGRARYASRGLCRRCYDRERRAGTLGDWSGHGIALRRVENPTLLACTLVGATRVSEDLEVPRSTVMRWARGGTPKSVFKRVKEYVRRLEALEREGPVTPERESLFVREPVELPDPWGMRGDTVYPEWDA